jgi:hypothetical protein
MFLVSGLLILPGLSQLEAAVPLASPCTLAWDLSQDPLVAGYALYCGIAGSSVTNRLALGITNTTTMFNLVVSSNYYFYLAAYDAKGIESPHSNILFYKPQALSPLKLVSRVAGTLNFQIHAAPRTVCWLQYTPTLNKPQWQSLGAVVADINGNMTISDRPPANTPSRFYRTIIP